MPDDRSRARLQDETRGRILDIAREVLGQNPDASMSDVATGAGVVRRTVYGYFPARADLVRTLSRQAVDEMSAELAAADATGKPADEVWVLFVSRLWPIAHRYRVLLALRRGEYGEEIHALLKPVDESLAGLVRRGQLAGTFASHLPAAVLSQLAFTTVFSLADSARTGQSLDATAAAIASLLVLGVPQKRAIELAEQCYP